MAQPTPFDRVFSFTNQQALTPTAPLRADKVDAELNAVKVTTDEIIQNLSLIQRDDGHLANGVVGPDQLADSLSLGIEPPVAWTLGDTYTALSSVFYGKKFYGSNVAHTATNGNRPDVDAVTWTMIADFTAESSIVVTDNSVYTAAIQALAVTAAKLAADSVTTAKILDANVTTAKINDLAITTGKLADDSVTAAKIAADAVGTSEIAALAVGTAEIAANAVTTAKLAREGSAGEVLTSNGVGSDPTYQAIPSATALPAGAIITVAMNTAPTGYLKCDGTAVSRATYATLFAALVKSATVTITITSPGVVTWTGHGLSIGDKVRFTTTGALPSGLTTGTDYFIISAGFTTDTFRLAATAGGSAINTSGSQSGTHTGISAPYGVGDGSTTFNVPDLRGEWVRGWDDAKGTDANRSRGSSQAEMIGPHSHTASTTGTTSSDGAHTHTVTPLQTGGSNAGVQDPISGTTAGTPVTTSSNGAHTHTLSASTTVNNNSGTENRVRNIALLYCIKT